MHWTLVHIFPTARGKYESHTTNIRTTYRILSSGGYSKDQAYFLHYIVHTIYMQLKDHPSLNRKQFQSWAHKRYEQIEKGQLIFIAKQIDVLAEIPK